jgi:FkbM family methyltransferase
MFNKTMRQLIDHILRRLGQMRPGQRSFSQEGEDIALARIFDGQADGFYVDVGACHPKRFSNTFFFYRRGWRGINIDATPGSMEAFRKMRPRDVNLEMAVGETESSLRIHLYRDPAFNTFSTRLVEKREKRDPDCKPESSVTLVTRSLRSILEQHVSAGQAIDFMSVDVEGMDLAVLRSNCWERFRPRCVIAEVVGKSVNEILEDPISTFMEQHGYELYSKLVHSVIFLDRR